MSFENAKRNLKKFGAGLILEELDFDENNTCILGIDQKFSLHITYEPNSDRIYLYSPILDSLPKDLHKKLQLYEVFLEGALLGGHMAGGAVGLAIREEIFLMHSMIDMAAADELALKRFAPVFVESVEYWRGVSQKVMDGQFDRERDGPKMPTPGAKMQRMAGYKGGGKMGDRISSIPAPGKNNAGGKTNDSNKKPPLDGPGSDSYIKI